ncbi:S9 family peptidase [Alteromonas aestuariivivens]|nr:S9 family peptidase [Alteromonas aestuariivivens]
MEVGLAGQKPVDVSRFLLARGVSRASINAQGTHVAFISSVTGRRQLWVQSLDGEAPAQLTFGNGISFYAWHPGGNQLLYGADNDGNEREAFYLIHLSGTSEQLILPHSDAFRAFGGFSPDGLQFTYASTERNGRDFDIYLHDLNTGGNTLVWQAEFGYFPSAWQPDSNQVVVTETRGEDAQDVYLLNLEAKSLTPWFKPEIAAAFSSFNWAPDGNTLYFTSNLDREMSAVFSYQPKTASLNVLATSDYDLESVALCNNGSTLIWKENRLGFDQLWVRALDSENARAVELPSGMYSLSCAQSSSEILVQISAPTRPAELYLVSADGKDVKQVSSATMAGIDASELVTPEPVRFTAQDGVTLHGLLYVPRNLTSPAPVVVDVHGGPTAQARASWIPITQYLVGKGIAVLDVNVRGSTGYGKTFARLDNQEKRLDSVRDLVDALAFLNKDPRIDASNAAVMGGSYGGYMVNAVMGLYPGAFKAGASFVGVSNWVRALQTASPRLKASDRIEYGDIREQKWQTFYAENSPINTVHKIRAPMLFQHGVNDPRDPVTESDNMVKVLRDKGIDVTYLRFPDEGHSVSKLENKVIFYRQLAAFLERHLTTTQ